VKQGMGMCEDITRTECLGYGARGREVVDGVRDFVGPNGCNCIGFVVDVVLFQKWAEGR
jgi:hypothetical protein